MPYRIVRNDITAMTVDVVVNSANPGPYIGEGVDGAIHDKGGQELIDARKALGHINVSEAFYTKGFGLLSKYVIHTVGPIYDGLTEVEQELRQTYINVLNLALTLEVDSIAFPLISSGTFGYPKRRALLIAQEEILRFLEQHEMMIYIVVYDKDSFAISKEFRSDVKEYIFNARPLERNRRSDRPIMQREFRSSLEKTISYDQATPSSLKNRISNIDEGFSKTLMKLIDDTNLKPSVIYNKANIDRRHFSKIKNDEYYQPTKNTVIAFSLALKLSKEELDDLLTRAGYTLSKSFRFDVIIEYCVENDIYDVFKVNEILFDFDQELLGTSLL